MRHPITLAFGLVLGVVLSSCPGKAQALQGTLLAAAYSQPALVSANFHPALAQPRPALARALPSQPPLNTAATSQLPRKPVPLQQVYVPPQYSRGQSHGSGDLIEEVRTPFTTESRVEVVRLWGGHMELNGVENSTHMQSVQLGPPGFASLRPVPDQERLGSATGYDGMSLVFNFGRDAHASSQPQAWHCLGLIKGRTSGCPL
jgi:hypothetical protein